MKQSITKLRNFLEKKFSFLDLVTTFEKDNYIELLFRLKDNQNYWCSTVIPYLLNSLSITKRYIKKETGVAFLWSVSTFSRKDLSVDETVEKIIDELMTLEVLPSIKPNRQKSNIVATVDISRIQKFMEPKENLYGNLDGGALLIQSSNPNAIKEIARSAIGGQ